MGEVDKMTRDELKKKIDKLMKQRADEKIDEATYMKKMMELTTSARDEFEKQRRK